VRRGTSTGKVRNAESGNGTLSTRTGGSCSPTADPPAAPRWRCHCLLLTLLLPTLGVYCLLLAILLPTLGAYLGGWKEVLGPSGEVHLRPASALPRGLRTKPRTGGPHPLRPALAATTHRPALPAENSTGSEWRSLLELQYRDESHPPARNVRTQGSLPGLHASLLCEPIPTGAHSMGKQCPA